MAKKRRDKPDEEETDFKIPKFDEEKFIRIQRRNIKTTFISFLFGIFISILSYFIWSAIDENLKWTLTLAFGFFSAAWLKYILIKIKIDLTDFGKKEWFSSYMIYFFTWLIVLIVLINPPFYDAEAPMADIAILPGMQEIGGTVKIVGFITDNTGIENVNFSITTPDEETIYPSFNFIDHIFFYTYNNNKMGEYLVNITAYDKNNLKTIYNGVFEYNNNALKIASTIPDEIKSADPILIKADDKISSQNFIVYYTIDDGEEILTNKSGNYYETSPAYEGWKSNSNVTVKLYAKVIHYFHMIEFNNTIEDTITTYNFTTADDDDIGTLPGLELKDLDLPQGKPLLATPGFEGLTLLVAIIGIILFFRYKKKKN